MLLILSINVQAQQDITQFLGIPVDGSEAEMISKLKAKGFQNDSTGKCLVGEFNGTQVDLYIVTKKDKVARIALVDSDSVDERLIRLRFNKLCKQFANNPKYIALDVEENCIIPENENISHEISVNKKEYEAIYYQQPAVFDTIAVREKVRSILLSKYSEEQLANPTEEIQSVIDQTAMDCVLEIYSKKTVWFTISEADGYYYISMYYDNEYNFPNGEDL